VSATHECRDDILFSGTAARAPDDDGALRRTLNDDALSGLRSRSLVDDANGRDDGGNRTFQDAAGRAGGVYAGALDGYVRGSEIDRGADGAASGLSRDKHF